MAHGVERVNGTGETLELAAPGRTTKVVPEGEIGSSADSRDRIFTHFDDGRYFESRESTEANFEDMIRLDGKAKTLEQVLTLPLRSAEHTIEPAEGDQGELEFCREALERPANAGGMSTPLDLVIAQATSAVWLRRAYFEKVFKVEGRTVTYDKLAFRPARTCSLLRDKTTYAFRGFKQRFMRDDDYVTEIIPALKAFVYIHGQHRNPLNGISDLDTARTIFESKQKVRFLWYSFLENQVIPKGVATAASPDDDKQRELAEKVASLKGGGVIGLGPDETLTAFESSNNGGPVFKQAMDYLAVEMAGSVLAGFTELPADGKGSYALSKDQSDFFLMSRIGVLRELAASITGWVLADLCMWNFGITTRAPSFRFKAPTAEAIDASIEMLQALATSPQPSSVPIEFLDLLTEKVAGHLGLPVDRVRKAIEAKRLNDGADTAAQQLQSGIAAATELVQAAGLGTAPPAELPAAAG